MKMAIENFAESVLEKLKEVLEGIYVVSSVSVMKNNDVLLHGIQIKHRDKNIAPIMYLDELFKQEVTVNDAVQWVLNTLYNSQADDIDTTDLVKYENVKSRIRGKLINYELNKEYLQDKIYVKFLDLAVVFCIQVHLDIDNTENAVIVINRSLFSVWDINEAQLFEVAKENMSKYEEYSFTSMFDVLLALQQNSQVAACDIEDYPESCGLYVLSNKQKVVGASVILNPNVLKEVSEILQDDLVLLPSSIHEWLVLKKSEANTVGDIQELYEMVKAVNDNEVAHEDLLSYNVYTYNRETDRMYIL
ncbi:MAG: hypothetical protein IJE43_19660 [Alphaproteobacteria bacterium]|nr:hypothetical protein [Alphaproteobacteria bacterium]